jgi:heat shock protein HtpX
VVAVTEGIMRLLSPEELRGVLGHEIGHIANRDILIQTVAGVMASAIVSIAHMMQFMTLFSGSRSNEGGSGSGNIVVALLMAILAPVAASIIQMAISRSREYLADDTGAALCGQPLALAAALAKLQSVNQRVPIQAGNAATSSMFIVAPFSAGSAASLFSTHPPIEERIARLQALARHEWPV